MDNRALETAMTNWHGVRAHLILEPVQKFLREQQHIWAWLYGANSFICD
jgi:hypothetical protein